MHVKEFARDETWISPRNNAYFVATVGGSKVSPHMTERLGTERDGYRRIVRYRKREQYVTLRRVGGKGRALVLAVNATKGWRLAVEGDGSDGCAVIQPFGTYIFEKSGNEVIAIQRSDQSLDPKMWEVERVKGRGAGKRMLVREEALGIVRGQAMEI